MPNSNLAEDILPLSELRSRLDQSLLDEVQLLKEIHTAMAQVEGGQGIPQEEARRRAVLGIVD